MVRSSPPPWLESSVFSIFLSERGSGSVSRPFSVSPDMLGGIVCGGLSVS